MEDSAANLACLPAYSSSPPSSVYAPALQVGLLSDDFVIAGWAERLELVHLEDDRVRAAGSAALLVDAPAAARRLRRHGSCREHRPPRRECGARVDWSRGGSGLRRTEAIAAAAMFVAVSGTERSHRLAGGCAGRPHDDVRARGGGAGDDGRTEDCRRPSPRARRRCLVKETAIVIPVLAALSSLGSRRLAASAVASGSPSSRWPPSARFTWWLAQRPACRRRFSSRRLAVLRQAAAGERLCDPRRAVDRRLGTDARRFALMRAVSIVVLARRRVLSLAPRRCDVPCGGCLRGLGTCRCLAGVLALLRWSAARRRPLRLSACRRIHDPARAADRTRRQSRRRSESGRPRSA